LIAVNLSMLQKVADVEPSAARVYFHAFGQHPSGRGFQCLPEVGLIYFLPISIVCIFNKATVFF
jgi:hypothetical protein